MTKIASKPAYPDKNPLSDNDFLVGTNGDTIKKETKSFPVSALRDYLISGLSPETGGTLKITEIVYSGVLTTPEAVANQLDPNVIVQRYEVLIFNINGDKYQLKLQNIVLGVLQDDVTADDFIPISLVASNLSESISFYKGYNSTTGREEHYSIGSVGFSITKEMSGLDETGVILLEQTEQTNLGTGVSVYKGFNATTKLQEYRRISSNTGTVTIDGETIIIDQTQIDINITQGANVTVTEPTPNNFVIASTDTIAQLQNGTTTYINGDGVSTPYSTEINNLQKTINTFPYTLLNPDDKYTIFVANGVSNVVINVPDGLVANFSCVFIQEGSGTVTVQESGTATLLYPSTTLQNIVKGQYYWAMVEKKIATNTYYLMGSLLPI